MYIIKMMTERHHKNTHIKKEMLCFLTMKAGYTIQTQGHSLAMSGRAGINIDSNPKEERQ